MIKIKEIINYLEEWAPPVLQESYDNSGLIVGDSNKEVTGVLVCLDSIEEVVQEAIEKKCNLIIAHHPIVFKGLKRFTGKNYVEKTVIKAIKNDIAIYAIHTNLDNVRTGVNAKICDCLGLENTQILAPKSMMKKIWIYMPIAYADKVKQSLIALGAGTNNDKEVFNHAGVGAGHHEAEIQLNLVFAAHLQPIIIKTLNELLNGERFRYDITNVEGVYESVGSGMVGELKKPMPEKKFLDYIKKQMDVSCIKYTALRNKPIQKVAVCGGAGGFLLNEAKRASADIFITSDYKYHEFFDAENNIIIADIGHYESEQYTIDLIIAHLKNKFTTFALLKTSINTNPVNYH